MSVLRPRNRILYFRVSEDEFQQFNHICESTGARSVSDLARSAMQNMIEEGNIGSSAHLSEKLTLLERMVSDLNHKVYLLTQSLRRYTVSDVESGRVTEEPESSDNIG